MMEHLENILASDLLERYVLGDVSPEERMKVDLLRIEHRVVRERLAKLEKSMEQMAVDNAISPPDHVAQAIVKQLRPSTPNANYTTSRLLDGIWWKLAAAFILGAVSIGIWKQNQISSIQDQLAFQKLELETLHRDCDALTEQYAFINATNTLPHLLEGQSESSSNQVIVYWNEELEKSLLRVVELSAIPANKTYQLWADVDGQMLSLGTFDAGLAIEDAIPMKYLANAESLNITIEPKGGSEHPTVSTLTVSKTI